MTTTTGPFEMLFNQTGKNAHIATTQITPLSSCIYKVNKIATEYEEIH
jgi:hypothetical protein